MKKVMDSFMNEHEKNFDECVFSCAVTKREVINKIGNFDENYTPAFFVDYLVVINIISKFGN